MLVAMVGLPGSGKSAYAVANYARIVSPDSIRLQEFNTTFDREVEPEVWRRAFERTRSALAGAMVVCFDATSVSRKRRGRLVRLAEELRSPVIAVWMDAPPDLCWQRNAGRVRPVPSDAFANLVRAFEPPMLDEGFDLVLRVRSA